MDHSRELYELMLLTYKSSLNNTKLAIKLQMENPPIIDSSCNCLNLSNIDNLIQKATNIKQKISFLKKNREYLFNKQPSHCIKLNQPEYIPSQMDSKSSQTEYIPSIESTTIMHESMTDKNNVKLEVNEKDDSEIIEVCKDEIIKEEMYKKIKKELRDKILDMCL